MKKYFAEFLGTFMLVLLGTGTIVIAKGDSLTIGLAFGLSVMIMIYTVGEISGGNFNPCVSVAMVINGRLKLIDGVFYIFFQSLGSIAASLIIYLSIHALDLTTFNFGQTEFPNINAFQAIGTEILISFLFVFVILMVTSKNNGYSQMAPIAIGTTLSFLIIITLNLTGGSLNPARSLGPALFAGGPALSNYWVYLVSPIIGSVIASFVAKIMGSEER